VTHAAGAPGKHAFKGVLAVRPSKLHAIDSADDSYNTSQTSQCLSTDSSGDDDSEDQREKVASKHAGENKLASERKRKAESYQASERKREAESNLASESKLAEESKVVMERKQAEENKLGMERKRAAEIKLAESAAVTKRAVERELAGTHWAEKVPTGLKRIGLKS
jgi:hypothetical protein